MTALVVLGASLGVLAQSPDALLGAAQKLIVVITPDWDTVQGTMARYQRQDGTWQQVGRSIPVVVGKNGLAWNPRIASGNSTLYPGPVKHEGDDRSPAGVFALTEIFGFASVLPGGGTYLPLTSNIECVDDSASRYYAQIVDRQKVGAIDWHSSEKMREVPGYRWGVVVDYNMDHTTKGDGSCIFLHQWSGPASGTAGCTAMPAADLDALVKWLAGEEHAALAQLPKKEYQRLRQRWHLP